MKILERLLMLIWGFVIFFGFVMIFGGLIMLFDPESERSLGEVLVLVFLIGGVPVGLGIWGIRRVRSRAARREGEHMERQLLQLAKENGGRLTVAEVALHLPINAEQARTLLDACHTNGLAELGVSEEGAVVYHFKLSS